MDIRGLKIEGKVLLAPMAGYTDPAFRVQCNKYGSALNFTEMISAKGVLAKNPRSLRMTSISKEEGKTAIQLFGGDPRSIADAMHIIEEDPTGTGKASMFDLNAGCPVRKVIEKGAGSVLLQKPELLGEIIRSMREATELPISVKMRLGWNLKDRDHVKLARVIEDNGADLLIVHGRYKSQGYSGTANWDRIQEIVDGVEIPVVGNGDVYDEESAKRMLEETKCDYVMVGRGAQGNPYILHRLNEFLKTGDKIEQKSRVVMFEEYLVLAHKYRIKNDLMKKQAMVFVKGMKNANSIRDSLKYLTDPGDFLELMRRVEKRDPNEI